MFFSPRNLLLYYVTWKLLGNYRRIVSFFSPLRSCQQMFISVKILSPFVFFFISTPLFGLGGQTADWLFLFRGHRTYVRAGDQLALVVCSPCGLWANAKRVISGSFVGACSLRTAWCVIFQSPLFTVSVAWFSFDFWEWKHSLRGGMQHILLSYSFIDIMMESPKRNGSICTFSFAIEASSAV